MNLSQRPHNRRGISTVVTTLIIVVASVVLAAGVVIYGTSIFQTGAQSESITTLGVKLWVNATDTQGVAWGVVAVRNTGDKIEPFDTIRVLGTTIPYSNWYFANTTNSLVNIQDQFVYGANNGTGFLKNYLNPPGGVQSTDSCTGNTANPVLQIDVDGAGGKPKMCFISTSGPISLKPGDSVIVYFHVPNGVLHTVDAGHTSSVQLYAGKTGAPETITVGNP